MSFSRTESPVSLDVLDLLRVIDFRTWALDVSDDASGGVVHELDADLGHTSTRTYVLSDIVPLHPFWLLKSRSVSFTYRYGRGLWFSVSI